MSPIFIAVCSEYNHVRTWSVTRFRGMISTQPGPTPLSSFDVVSLDQGLKSAHTDKSSIGRFIPYWLLNVGHRYQDQGLECCIMKGKSISFDCRIVTEMQRSLQSEMIPIVC